MTIASGTLDRTAVPELRRVGTHTRRPATQRGDLRCLRGERRAQPRSGDLERGDRLVLGGAR